MDPLALGKDNSLAFRRHRLDSPRSCSWDQLKQAGEKMPTSRTGMRQNMGACEIVLVLLVSLQTNLGSPKKGTFKTNRAGYKFHRASEEGWAPESAAYIHVQTVISNISRFVCQSQRSCKGHGTRYLTVCQTCQAAFFLLLGWAWLCLQGTMPCVSCFVLCC